MESPHELAGRTVIERSRSDGPVWWRLSTRGSLVPRKTRVSFSTSSDWNATRYSVPARANMPRFETERYRSRLTFAPWPICRLHVQPSGDACGSLASLRRPDWSKATPCLPSMRPAFVIPPALMPSFWRFFELRKRGRCSERPEEQMSR